MHLMCIDKCDATPTAPTSMHCDGIYNLLYSRSCVRVCVCVCTLVVCAISIEFI